MDIALIACVSAASLAILSFVLSYDIKIKIFPKPEKIQKTRNNYTTCLKCGWKKDNLIDLEKCTHTFCKDCIDKDLSESSATWIDHNSEAYKISACRICKEFFREGGKKIY